MQAGRALGWWFGTLLGCLVGCSGVGNVPVSKGTPATTSQPASVAVSAPRSEGANAPSPAISRKTRTHGTVPGEYLVKFRLPTDPVYADGALKAAQFTTRHRFHSVPGLYHVIAGIGVSPHRAAAKLARDPAVAYIEPNFTVKATAVPNDPMFFQQWGLNNTGLVDSPVDPDIGAEAAWNLTTGSANVVIAVIDSGIDYTHPDLAANMWVNPPGCAGDDTDGYPNDCHGINAITGTGDPMDDFFHGTHVAGIIGAVGNNSLGVTGVNWTVALLACKFLDSSGSGTTADAITCLDYVAQQKQSGVNIVATNNSWGSTTYSQALGDAIAAQRQLGILFITAAGNNYSDEDQNPFYPCGYDHSNVVCVAAAADSLAYFSDYGAGTVHLGAPGLTIWSTVLNGQYAAYDGTSMATAFVTGVAGLLAAQDPTRDWRAIKNLILAGTVRPTQDTIPSVTGGRLSAINSMTCSNSIVTARTRPPLYETITLAVGGSLELEAINIDCAAPNSNVTVDVEPGGETVTLVDDGTGDDEVAGDGVYTGAWTASAGGSYTLTFQTGDVVNVFVDPLLKSGFPTQMYIQPDAEGQIPPPAATLVVGNLDGNPGQQILAPGYANGPLYVWRSDGTAEPGWPNYDIEETVEVSLGTFASGAPSSVVAAGYYSGNLWVYSGDGTAVSGWPQSASNNYYYPPPTGDVSGNGIDTIISYPAYNANGTLFSTTATIPPSGQIGPIAVADLDAVGQLNFVSASTETLWASSASGMKPGFPVSLPAHLGGGWSNVVIGDVDGDGRPEIIVSGLQAADPDGQGPIHLEILIYNNYGVLESTLSVPPPVSTAMVALADLDGDGIPEIVMATGPQLYAWKGNGSLMPGFPVLVGTAQYGYAGPVAVGDIDGDGYPDIVFMSTGGISTSGLLNAIDRHGVVLSGFPRPILYMSGATTPAIADLDGSGRNDLVITRNPSFGMWDSIFAYDLQGPGPYGPVEWGQYMGDATHQGYYETGKNLTASAYLTAQAHGAGVIVSSDGAINCGASCIHLYAKGSVVKLTATAGNGAAFTQWLGACAGQANPCSVTVSGYTAASADFASPVTVSVAGAGTVTSSPAGINCPGVSCSATFPARTMVTLTATAAKGYPFNGWGGNCSGTAATCGFVINAADSATAQFGGPATLSVALSGTGSVQITSSPTGISCGSSCTAGFTPGTLVKLSAAFSPNSYVQNWGVAGCAASESTCSITLNADTSIVVAVAPKLSMPVDVSGAGSVAISAASASPTTCSSSCTYLYQPGVALTLVANPSSNSTFAGWSGGCSGTSSTCTFTPSENASVSAAFNVKPSSSSGGGALDRWTCALLIVLVLARARWVAPSEAWSRPAFQSAVRPVFSVADVTTVRHQDADSAGDVGAIRAQL
jgi:subtilisin family serine protease